MRQGAGLIKMLVLMVLMAALMLIGFSVYANWDKDANNDGEPDGFTLRLLDLDWYGIAGERARPIAKDLKKRLLQVKDDVVAEGGLLDKGEAWLGGLVAKEAEGQIEKATGGGVKAPEKTTNKREILHKEQAQNRPSLEQRLAMAEAAVANNDPDGSYKFETDNVAEKPTLHLEDDIFEASNHFATGLAHYRSAFDKNHELRPGFEKHLEIAERELRATQDMLTVVVPEYGKRTDSDPAFYESGRDILLACNELITLTFDDLPRQ